MTRGHSGSIATPVADAGLHLPNPVLSREVPTDPLRWVSLQVTTGRVFRIASPHFDASTLVLAGKLDRLSSNDAAHRLPLSNMVCVCAQCV
jgi:hypothetical protein